MGAGMKPQLLGDVAEQAEGEHDAHVQRVVADGVRPDEAKEDDEGRNEPDGHTRQAGKPAEPMPPTTRVTRFSKTRRK